MSTRERWIVYPLLFLTLGIALRDKIGLFRVADVAAHQIRCDQLQAGTIFCQQAEVEQTAKIRQIGCESLVVIGSRGKPLVAIGVDRPGRNGVIDVLSEKGVPLVQLHSAEGNGLVTTVGRDGRIMVMGIPPQGKNQSSSPAIKQQPAEKKPPAKKEDAATKK